MTITRVPFSATIAVAAFALAACQNAEQRLTEAGAEPMTAEQVRAVLVADVTMKSRGVSDRGTSWTWAGRTLPDGVAVGRAWWNDGETHGKGVWEITDAGEYCTKWDNDWNDGRRECSRVYQDGPGKLVFARTDQAETTEIELVEGNPFNL